MNDSFFHELRIYTVIPGMLPTLLSLWENEGKPIIDKYMRCLGVWTTETGILNQVYHLYFWESHQQRDIVRNNFYMDPLSQAYVKKVKITYQKQESYFLKPTSFMRKEAI